MYIYEIYSNAIYNSISKRCFIKEISYLLQKSWCIRLADSRRDAKILVIK